MAIIREVYHSLWWLNVLLALWIIYLGRRRSARSTMMWVMVLAILPIAGFFLYLLMGRDYRRAKMFRLKSEEDDYVQELVSEQDREIRRGALDYVGPEIARYSEVIRFNLNADEAFFSDSNGCEVFFDGIEKFNALFRDIDEAKESIDMEYYIFKNDELGRNMLRHLEDAASRGVKVRLLVDAVGGRWLPYRVLRKLKECGGQFALFFPAWIKVINFRLNYRNHRKITIIDNYIGYIGGFNVGNEYIGRNKRLGYWRDTHLRITGHAVADLKIRFIKDWLFASKEDPAKEPDVDAIPNDESSVAMQLVTSGPDTPHNNIKYAMIQLIYSAKHRIIIQSPYLVPDTAFMDALISALVSGVQVDIMIPNKPDHPFVYWATTSNAGILIGEGAKVWRYEAGFLHAKTMLIDDMVSIVGSANVDERSFSLNFEASQIIYDQDINEILREQFERDAERSTLITKEMYANRPLIQRIKEPISRLFSPLL